MTQSSCIFLLSIFIGGIIAISILFSLQQFNLVWAQDEQIYQNLVSGLKVSYPSGWSVNEKNVKQDGTGYVEFLPPNFKSSIRIGNTYTKFSPESIAKGTIHEIGNTSKDFRLISEGPITINDRHAYDVFLEYKHPNKGMIRNEHVFIEADNNNRLYSFALQGVVSLGEYIQMATVLLLRMANSAEFIGFGQGAINWI